MDRHFIKAALGAVALACATGAQATMTFDGPGLDTSYTAFGPDLLTDHDVLLQGGVAVQLLNINNASGAADGSLAGAVINGSTTSCGGGLVCPNASSAYLAVANDAIVAMFNPNSKPGLRLNGFSASFIGTDGNVLSQSSGFYTGLIRLFGVTASGSSGFLNTSFWLEGLDDKNALNFQHFSLSDEDRNTDFIEIDFVGYACDISGSCDAFTTNRGQFALDDIDVTPIPEPASLLLLGAAGLAAFAAGRKARRPLAA